ncbi:hypothetical protein A4U61_18200 [Streptomyces sp. H-KF8]|nr:hypothetical protein A4U61_18200 [Streptomyces sp. H-KF8]
MDACAELVAYLLRRVPALRVLAVGRRALSVAGERLVPPAPPGEDETVRRALRGTGAAGGGPAPEGSVRRAAAGAPTQEPAASPAREGGETAG